MKFVTSPSTNENFEGVHLCPICDIRELSYLNRSSADNAAIAKHHQYTNEKMQYLQLFLRKGRSRSVGFIVF